MINNSYISRNVDVEGMPLIQSSSQTVTASSPRHAIALIFLTWSLGMAMTVSQDYVGEDSALRYFMFTAPILLAAASRPFTLASGLLGKTMWLIPFVFLAGFYHSIQGDVTAALQVLLLVIGLIWFSSPNVYFNPEDLYKIYIGAIVVGFFVWVFTDFNRWGLIPGTTDPLYGIWRVSFFSNIAFTAFFSLFIVLIATKENWWSQKNRIVLYIALYFLIFSFVRTALICFLLYIFSNFVLKKINRPIYMFLFAIFVSVFANVFIGFSSYIFNAVQEIPVISRLFLRGETQLSEFEIYQQLYRPWLWGEQLKLFWSSAYLMGWGSIPFYELVQNNIFDYRLEVSDTVSLPTKLLSQFGLPAVFFWIFLIACLWQTADRMDRWGCAVFPVIFTAMMHWGSMFHVTDPMAVLYFGLLVKGSGLLSASNRSPKLLFQQTTDRMLSLGIR